MPAPSPPLPGPAGLAASVTLSAKLVPPGIRPQQVQRAALAGRIAGAGSVKLVLVRAPAGFGKTTLMLQAREQIEATGVATAWLTLDRADNDVPRFLAGLAAAVRQLGLEPRAPHAARGAALDVVEALARDDLPFALFLDDAEALQEPAVLGLLREVLERLPRRGQLIVGSRSLPDLGLGRMRARGQLLEIDAELLRFSRAEAAEFFRLRSGPALAAETLDQLHHKTEGWITALWLVAMALERRGTVADFVERFSGSNRAVADYLAEDVLAHQPAEVRNFLLRTSLLRQLDAAVCRALLPRVDCARMLQRLEAAHLFVTPIGDEGGEPGPSYRYHSLFADFLRAQLAREQPDEVARLHLAASGWYEAQGRPVPAIDHAIEGGDHPHALHLLARHAEGFLEQGRMRLLDRWFNALPAGALHDQALLQVIAVWAHCFTHGPWGAMQQLETSGVLRSREPAVLAHVNALQPMLLAMMDQHQQAYAAGRQSLDRLPSGRPFPDSVLSNAMAHIVSVMGEQHEAHRLLDDARRLQAGSTFNRMYTESLEGVLDLKAGRLRQATARLRIAVNATPHAAAPVGYSHTNGNAWAGVLYAGVVYEANELQAAEHLLNVYLPLARDVGLPDHMIASHRMRARIAFQRGDVDAAFELLTGLEYLGHHRQLPRVVASAKLERARMLLLQGHGPAAKQELDRADDPAVWQRVRLLHLPAHDTEDMLIGRLRWDLHFGALPAGLPALRQALDQALADALAQQRLHRALKLRVLLALAHHRAGDAVAASAELDSLLQHASREGFVRVIVDEGPALVPLLQHARHGGHPGHAAGRPDDPILADFVQRLFDALGAPALADDTEPEAPAATPQQAPAEPLTHKELRVLQLLAEGYSNSAMAEKLFVSDSTVRTHLRNINQKLGAHSRTQAVAMARKLRVIA